MPTPSYSVDISYKLSPTAEQAFLDMYFAGVNNEVCETFASRWGGLDQDAFQRAFAEGQGDDKYVAILALGLNATSEMISHLLFLLSSSKTPRLERWASALCLGRMKEQSAYPFIEALLLDGLSLEEYIKENQPAEKGLHHELRVCAIKRNELFSFLHDWTSPTFLQTLRQGIKNTWDIEKTLHLRVASYDDFAYALGMHGAFGALVGLGLLPAYWKTAIVYMSLGSFHAQAPLIGDLKWDLDSNPMWQQKVASILAEQFGLTKEEQDDCITNFSFYARTRSVVSPVEKGEKEHINEVLDNDDDESEDLYEDEEDEDAYMVPLLRISTYSGHTAPITSLSWSPDGTSVVSGSEDGTVQIWESLTGKPYLTFNEHRESIKVVAWSPQDNLIASGGNDRAVRVWDARTGEQIWEGIGHSAWICDLAWSPDGTRIASVALDKTVRVWDISGKRLVHVLRGHEAVVTSVAWSPDGERLVSGSGYPECLIFVWNARTGEQEAINRWHAYDENEVRPHTSWLGDEAAEEDSCKPSTVHYLSWSPNGRQIVSASDRSVCHIWDALTGEEVMATDRTAGPVDWSSDGTTLFFSNGAREIEVWEVSKNTLKAIYQLNAKHCISVFRISPDGKYVVADDETRIGVWRLP